MRNESSSSPQTKLIMRRVFPVLIVVILLALPLGAQTKRLWVLRPTDEMVEYDPATFATKQTVKLPAEAGKSPANVDVNRLGQILFAPTVSLPLSEEDVAAPHKVWIWKGQAAASIDLGITRKQSSVGSNQAVTDLVPAAYLSADGAHLYWFVNEARRVQREDIDFSMTITWKAWRTNLSGGGREELTSTEFPDCTCKTGSCEESCPVGLVWVPDNGVDKFFLLTQFVAGQTSPIYKASTKYDEDAGKWTAKNLSDPLQRVLDASSVGDTIVGAVPDTGCCGWSNQSNDQTFVLTNGNKIAVFDEQATYKNQDYDVSFLTSNAKLSPDSREISMTITSTAQANKPIQLAEQGQANPEESQRIRKALTELPAVVVKSVEDSPKQIASVPHATLVGWINDKEMLIVEDHLLVVYNVGSGARKKSSVRVEDAGHVFLR